jgi:hypothetical protein
MIRNIWFSPAVLDALENKQETITTCSSCLAQFMQDEASRCGNVNTNTKKFEENVEKILREVIAEHSPSVKDVLKFVFTREHSDVVDIAVHFYSYVNYSTAFLH